jgi:hypothetical protein
LRLTIGWTERDLPFKDVMNNLQFLWTITDVDHCKLCCIVQINYSDHQLLFREMIPIIPNSLRKIMINTAATLKPIVKIHVFFNSYSKFMNFNPYKIDSQLFKKSKISSKSNFAKFILIMIFACEFESFRKSVDWIEIDNSMKIWEIIEIKKSITIWELKIVCHKVNIEKSNNNEHETVRVSNSSKA